MALAHDSTPDKDDILHGGAALYGGSQLYFLVTASLLMEMP